MNLQNQIDFIKYQPDMADMFDGVAVPAPFDAERVKSAIVMRCGLLTPIYSQPYVMREAVAQWFYEQQWNLEHLAKMVLAEYDPIHNYDRTETKQSHFTEEGSNSETNNRNLDAARDISESGSDSETYSGTDNTEKVEQVSAENESGFQNDRKENTDVTYGKKIAGSQTKNTDDDLQETEVNTKQGTDQRSGNDSYTLRAYGNIGVTTNFQMLEGEKELITNFNPYKWIAEQFENDMCIMVY